MNSERDSSSTNLDLGSRLSTNATNPAFTGIDRYLNIFESRIGEEFAMLIDRQQFHSREQGVFFRHLCYSALRAAVNLSNDDQSAARLDDPQNFAHIVR